jgi:stage V sporulation protein B
MLSKKIANASAITIIFTVISLGLGIVIHSLIGRIYGPEGLGLYASFMMFIGLYSMFAIFGIPSALSKYIAEYEEKQEFKKIKESFSSVLIFVTFSSLMMGLLAYYITPYLAGVMHIDAPSELYVFVLVALLFFIYSQVSQSFYRGLLNALKSSLIQIISLVGILGIVLYAYFFAQIPVYYAIVFGYVVSGFFGLLLCIKDRAIATIFSKNELYKILKFALPIALMSYFGFIAQWTDRIVLGIYLGVAEIGLFTAGMMIIQATRQIPASLTPILVPSYSKIHVYGKENVERALNLNIKLAAIFLFFVGSLTLLYATDIVFIIYGSNFGQTVLILQILSIGTFLTAITIPTTTLITGSGHPKLNLYLNLMGIPTQIILIVLLTKYYGMVGTAIANPLTGLVYAFGTLFMVSKVLETKIYWESLITPALAWISFIGGYLMILTIFNNTMFAGIVGTIIYAFICWKKVLSTNDKTIIREIRDKK